MDQNDLPLMCTYNQKSKEKQSYFTSKINQKNMQLSISDLSNFEAFCDDILSKNRDRFHLTERDIVVFKIYLQ